MRIIFFTYLSANAPVGCGTKSFFSCGSALGLTDSRIFHYVRLKADHHKIRLDPGLEAGVTKKIIPPSARSGIPS